MKNKIILAVYFGMMLLSFTSFAMIPIAFVYYAHESSILGIYYLSIFMFSLLLLENKKYLCYLLIFIGTLIIFAVCSLNIASFGNSRYLLLFFAFVVKLIIYTNIIFLIKAIFNKKKESKALFFKYLLLTFLPMIIYDIIVVTPWGIKN